MSENELKLEAKAKGHVEKNVNVDESHVMEGLSEESNRGLQHGFGKNQGKEAVDRIPPFGTRAPGATHG
jgi:hypothetical protein